MTKKKTIVDIAEAAGVSVSTVSRILNNKPDVAAETRQRVLQIIEEQRFAPQAAWQQLRSGRSRVISLHFPQDFNPPSQAIITSAALGCESAGYTLNLIAGSLSENDLLAILDGGQADGIVLAEILARDWRVELLRQHNAPFVMIGRCEDSAGLSYVDFDIGAGMIDDVGHLFELGHRAIGLLIVGKSSPAREYGFTAWARQGYETACRQFGLPALVSVADLDSESVTATTIDLLERRPEITALVAPQSSAIPGILRAVQSLALRIPDDLSVIGLLDESIAEVMTPPLTAISFPSRQLGSIAIDLLLARLDGLGTGTQQILVRPALSVRGSTGPARPRLVAPAS